LSDLIAQNFGQGRCEGERGIRHGTADQEIRDNGAPIPLLHISNRTSDLMAKANSRGQRQKENPCRKVRANGTALQLLQGKLVFHSERKFGSQQEQRAGN